MDIDNLEFKIKAEILQAILEESQDAVLIVDQKSVITHANKSCLLMFSYHKDEIIDKSLDILIPGDAKLSHQEKVKMYFKDPYHRKFGTPLDLRGIDRLGNEFQVDIMLNPLLFGDELVVVSMIRRENDLELPEKLKRMIAKLDLALGNKK